MLDEATYSAKRVDMGVDGVIAAVTNEPLSNGHIKQPNGIGKHPVPQNHLMDLLSFLPDEQPPSSPKSAGDALLNLLGAGSTSGSNSITSPGMGFSPASLHL